VTLEFFYEFDKAKADKLDAPPPPPAGEKKASDRVGTDMNVPVLIRARGMVLKTARQL